MRKLQLKRKGITLIEILITLAILGIVIQIIYSIFFVGNKSFYIGKNKAFTQQDARIASDCIMKELRTAKYITPEKPITGKYYSLSINQGKLIKETIIDGIEQSNPKTLFPGSLTDLKFNYTIGNPKGIIEVEVTAGEKEQQANFKFDTLLENIPDYETVIDSKSIIYYIKYE